MSPLACLSLCGLNAAAWVFCRLHARAPEPLVSAWAGLCRLRDRAGLGWTDEEMERALARADAIRKGERK